MKKNIEKSDDDIGVFLETAHPIKFSESVEKIINKKVVIPERIKKVLEGKKKSVEINSYSELKLYYKKLTHEKNSFKFNSQRSRS